MVITLADVYQVVQETRSLVTGVSHRLETVEQRAIDHEARLRVVEQGRWPIPTLAVLIALVSVLWNIFGGK